MRVIRDMRAYDIIKSYVGMRVIREMRNCEIIKSVEPHAHISMSRLHDLL